MEKSHQLETSAQLVTQYDEVIERHKCIILLFTVLLIVLMVE